MLLHQVLATLLMVSKHFKTCVSSWENVFLSFFFQGISQGLETAKEKSKEDRTPARAARGGHGRRVCG